MDVIGTCTSMALQYGVPLFTLVDKFRHARFEPSGMTSNKDIPFAKSLIDYIFCWLGCQFIPGYADKNMPNRAVTSGTPDGQNVTTARELVEKTRDLARKIAEAKAGTKAKIETPARTAQDFANLSQGADRLAPASMGISTDPADRIGVLVGSSVADPSEAFQAEAKVLQQFNAQFEHFGDDAPACDVCGSITVRNGTCYKCYNCGNSMGCS